MTTTASPILAGTTLGHYVVRQLLGVGGMGEVYEAEDTRLHRAVALKVVRHDVAADPARRMRLEREASAVAMLNHPRIVTVHSLEEHEGVLFLTMELIKGQTLAELILPGGFPLPRLLKVSTELADALNAAHARGVVHRDLKPANVMITRDGAVKVLDFGLSQIAVDESAGRFTTETLTVDNRLVGTVPYMSPEQIEGKPADTRSDIFSLGVILFEMATGTRPFGGGTPLATLTSVLKDDPPLASDLNAAIPDEVARIIDRCLVKDPERRVQSAADLSHQLDDLARMLKSGRWVPVPATRSRRVRARTMVSLAMALLIGAAAAYYARREPGPLAPSSRDYVQITNFTDAAMAPSLSPDGRMIAFKRGTNTADAGTVEDFLGAGQLYVKLLPGGDAVQLTNRPGSKYGPVFTPDGSGVAYTQLSSAGKSLSWDTWTVPVLGGMPTQLLANASGLTWIDPNHVLFSEIKTGLHMGIVTATETRADERAIYFPALELGMAHYSYLSPDRRSILVVEMANTHAFDAPCRLVPFDGSSPGRSVGPNGTCLSAAWSPDGRWMYFAAQVNGGLHLWRQPFPDGTPEQFTFGATEERGIAFAPDGRSLITSIGRRLSAIWIHDAAGERAITSEGYASAAHFSADGKRAFYLESATSAASTAGPAPAGQLRSVEIASGRTEDVLPGVAVADYDVSPDGTAVAYTTSRTDGPSEVFIAPIDHRSPPIRLASTADQVSFGTSDMLFFRAKEGKLNFLDRVHADGSGRARVSRAPILIKYGVSPDGKWIAAAVSRPADRDSSSDAAHVPLATVALPADGGAPQTICGQTCDSQWSRDGKLFSIRWGGARGTLLFPVPPGRSLPPLPATGIGLDDALAAFPGARAIPRNEISFASDPATYLFRRAELHANLFRVPIP